MVNMKYLIVVFTLLQIVAALRDKLFGDKCRNTNECGFEGSVCDDIIGRCVCQPELPVTNHLDKCGRAATINESCHFNEQCEAINFGTECREGVCICRYGRQAVVLANGQTKCVERLEHSGVEQSTKYSFPCFNVLILVICIPMHMRYVYYP